MGVVETTMADVLIARDAYLYVPQSNNRRLLLKPGSMVLEKKIPLSQVYKRRIRVISAGGIEGEIRGGGVNKLMDITGALAYAKGELVLSGNKYGVGTMFPVRRLDEGGEISYDIQYARTWYDPKRSRFMMSEKSKNYGENDFYARFSMIDPEQATDFLFPIWSKNDSHSPTEWGCGHSTEVSTTLDASASASVSGGGGFFSFFTARAEANAASGTSTVYRKKLEDEQYRHRITYWMLSPVQQPDHILVEVALEKISLCDTTMGVNNSYIIRFDKRFNFDEITINPVWAAENGFKKGGGSPIRIDSLDDLSRFEDALKDFKFMHSHEGYDIRQAISHFAIMLAANLNYSQ